MSVENLSEIFTPQYVITEPDKLADYADDMTEAEPQAPAAVVFPENVEQIRKLVSMASAQGLTLTPRIANQNVGGLAIASEGGVVVDLTRMNAVVDFSPTDMYAVIEPGVTQQEMKDYLDEKAPNLRIGYSLAPPDTSVLANCIMDGLSNYSLKCGSMSEAILGLEAVLHDGTVVKTGAWAMGPTPYGRPPLPDLTGLFVAWLGTTGIVTKISLALWPQHPYRRRFFVLARKTTDAFEVVRRLVKLELLDDLGVLSWPTGRMMLGVEQPHHEKDAGEYAYFMYLDISAPFADQLDYKVARAAEVFDAVNSNGGFTSLLDLDDLVKAMPEAEKFREFPTDLEFLTKTEGGGLSWVGTYGPLSRIDECCDAGMACMAKHGFAPGIVCRAMKTGHYAVLRFVELFDVNCPEERARVRALNLELFDLCLEYGFVQYKPPLAVIPQFHDKIQPASLKLMKRVKELMDPDNIFNPGKLGL